MEQLVTVREVTRRVEVALRIKPAQVGTLVNKLRHLAHVRGDLPLVQLPPNPKNDFILALAQAGGAQCTVTGDQSGLLALRGHAGAEILTAAKFVSPSLA